VNQPPTFRLSSWARLVSLALLLGVGVLASLGLATRTAHAQPAATIIVSTCNEATLDSAISSAGSGDTISFGCSGDITLTSTLTISKNLTLDGSGQTVTLDGGNSVQVLSVTSGVSFTLKALTIAHGVAAYNASFGIPLGGGLFNNGGTVSISNSTFANNSAVAAPNSIADGGGLYNNGGTVTISNSTFANNSASSGIGGGLFNNGGTVTISNSTFADNSASPAGGGLVNDGGTVNIGGSIVANNVSGVGDPNCYDNVPLHDQGYNLESRTDCGFTGTGSLRNTNPQLSPLANNGGPTQTMALQQGSPAIDAIPVSTTLCPSTDQRGMTRPDDNETSCDMGAYESNYPADSDLGLTNLPSDITVNATSPQGAVVTFTPPTVVDEDSSLPTVSCTSASGLTSGSIFPIGTTKVTCTASDSDDVNSPVSQSFTVTVNDTDLALTNMPTNMTVNATSPQGAVVTYTTPTVVDEDSPLPTATCAPASGSTFAIGTTTVTCTASDSDDTNSPVSAGFTVTVNGAATQVNELIATINGFHLPGNTSKSYISQLQMVQADLSTNNTAQACLDLTGFINHVKAQSGKQLTVSQATQLIAAARQIQAVLGC
jgi:hypothetical protein